MEKRKLGKSSIEISRVGLGGATFGREIDEKTSIEILNYALDNGITFIDTAEAYGGGNVRAYRKRVLGIDDVRETTGEDHSSEKIIGRWLKSTGRRKEIVLETKV